VPDERDQIAETLRGRLLRGLQSGALVPGDRLPSARELEPEFGVDHRVILGAYRQLATEGVVTMRTRGGIYVAAHSSPGDGIPPLPESWFVEVLTQGLRREIPAPELSEWLRRATETLRLRAVVVASTADQLHGLARELRDDFGLEAEELLAADVTAGPHPLAIRRADLIVTTEAHAERMQSLGRTLRKEVIAITVRPDLVVGEWAVLLRRPVYAVVATPEFEAMLRTFFAGLAGAANLHTLVPGRDDLAAIPDDAPTYVTQSARALVGDQRIPGRILPAARTISAESAREIFAVIVRANVSALSNRAR